MPDLVADEVTASYAGLRLGRPASVRPPAMPYIGEAGMRGRRRGGARRPRTSPDPGHRPAGLDRPERRLRGPHPPPRGHFRLRGARDGGRAELVLRQSDRVLGCSGGSRRGYPEVEAAGCRLPGSRGSTHRAAR